MQQASMHAHTQAQAPLPVAGEFKTEAGLLLQRARNAAFAEAAQGRLGQGLSLLQQALEQEPIAHDLLSDMAALLLAAGELSHAAAHARQALEIMPQHGASLYTLGFAQSGLGQLEQARETLGRLLQGEALSNLLQEAEDLLPIARTELARLEALR